MVSDGDDNTRRDDPLAVPAPPPFFEEEKHDDDDDDDDGGGLIEIDLEALVEENTEEEPSPREIHRNRAFMTVLHFVLTYPRWSFSLFLLFANWTTPLPTAKEQVTQPVRDLQAVVRTEAKLYHECVKTSFQFQDVHMDQVVAVEQERVAVARAAQQIAQTAVATDQCYNTTIKIQRSLQQWYRMGFDLLNETTWSNATTMCSADDQERFNEILGADLTVLNNSIQSILEAYIAQSLQTLRTLLQYSRDRSSYDYDYFVGIKIQAIIGVLDQFAVPAIQLTLPEQELALQLRNILQGLLDALHGAYVRIDLLTLRLVEFEASIQAFKLNYIKLYSRFKDIRIFVLEFLPTGVSLPKFFDISGIPVAAVLMPPVFEIPQFGPLPDIEDLISEYIIKAMQLIAWLLEEAAKEASEQTRRIIEEILELLRQLTLLEDYDPPKYPRSEGVETPEDEVARLDNLADKTRVATQVALDGVVDLFDDVPEPGPSDLGDVDNSNTIENNQTQFNLLNLSVPEIQIPVWILTVVGYVFSYSFVVECLIQAVRFYRLKRKYERHSVPELPEIDYLVGTEEAINAAEEEKEAKPSKLEVAKSMLLKNMMNPMVIVGLVIFPFVLSVFVFWFPHVKASCIDSRRGTFLARRVFKPIQVNKANVQGYALHTLSQSRCHRKQRAVCRRQSRESDVALRNDAAALFALQTHFNDSTEILGVVDRCVDTDKLDGQFWDNCCGLEGYVHDGTDCLLDQQRDLCLIDDHVSPPTAFRPVGESLLDSACQMDANLFSTQGALFNCSVLEESCNRVPCSGVDADLIEEMTIEADCSGEIYFIQVCLFLALMILHAIMINIWNALLFNGVMHLRWRKLKSELKFTTHVTTSGELVKGGDVQERTDRIEKAMKRFELSGWIQIGLSAAVFLVWLVTFVALKKLVAHLDMYHA